MKRHIGLRRGLSLLLTVVLCMPLGAGSASAADTKTVAIGTTEIWEWKLAATQSELPSDQESHPVMLLYQVNGKTYMIDGSKHTSGEYFKFLPTEVGDGLDYNSETFRTKDNISNMTLKYTGEKDTDNGGAKICEFAITEDGKSKTLSLDGDGFCTPSVAKDAQKITVLTANRSSKTDVEWKHVMLFHNVSLWGDLVVQINSGDGTVYAERSWDWDLGQFKLYIGTKVTLSALTHDYTISSGGVANFNDYVYMDPGVTITVEKGGVLSVSGVLYNNGTIVNNGGDIVVQKNATIEQFGLNGSSGGSIRCNAGDLVILEGGRVCTGTTADMENSYGCGFVLENGATCTNFGTLVVGSASRVDSGSTLDNRSSGAMFFGCKLTSVNSGNLHNLAKTTVQSKGTYESSSSYNAKERVYSRVDLLYVGSDVMLYNQGYVWLDAWADQLSGADNITSKGSGTITASKWCQIWTGFGWTLPDMWYAMWNGRIE